MDDQRRKQFHKYELEKELKHKYAASIWAEWRIYVIWFDLIKQLRNKY